MKLQLFLSGAWHDAATLSLQNPTLGVAGPCTLQYNVPFARQHLGRADAAALSCRFPVDFASHQLERWPPFTLDLLPGGHARRNLSQRLGIGDGPAADAPLLETAHAPVGNLRVNGPFTFAPHPGFEKEDILSRREDFIEYAHEHGASVAGSSGAQGDAPKFLLVEDHHGRWHSEGALPDDAVARHWLVKFPRGRTERDKLVLRTEAAYMRVAAELGLRVAHLPTWERDALFVPRFDRDKTRRHGVESLCSLAGVSEFGARIPQESLLSAVLEHTDDPEACALEFIQRDMLNVALANTDNHARNTAVLKPDTGGVTLSPLYDFAPMALDPEGIARACRWRGEDGGRPDWQTVAGPRWEAIRAFGLRLADLPEILRRCAVDPEVVSYVLPRIATMQEQF